MTTSDERTVTAFDHHSVDYAENSASINAELRTRCPVAHTPAHGGFWVLSRYGDVTAAAKDDDTFASGYTVNGVSPLGVAIPPSPAPHYPIEMDPPEFTPYRKLLNPLFSPAASKAWKPRVDEWVDICIDQVIEKGSIDLVADLSNAVTSLVTCEFLGIPTADWRAYATVQTEMIHASPDERPNVVNRYLELLGRIHGLIVERQEAPGDGVIGTLLKSEIDGEPISNEMILSLVDTIMAGGFDTTTGVTANALIYLADNPTERKRLIEDPSMIPQACEEFLRYFTPQPGLARTVTKPVSVGGVELQPGERVYLSWASANRDETVFDRPEEVILDRFPNRHTTFGVGIHRCIGAHFARIELIAMVSGVLARMPDYQVRHETAVRYPTIGIVDGWVNVPATFTPDARVGDESLPGSPENH